MRQNGRTLALKAWNLADRAAELVPGARVDLAFNLEEDAYSAARGYPAWAAILRDFRADPEARGRHFAARQFAAIARSTGSRQAATVFRTFRTSAYLCFLRLPRASFRHSPCIRGRHAHRARNQHERGNTHEEIHYQNCGDRRIDRRSPCWRRDRARENGNHGGGGTGSANPPDVATIVARQVSFLTTPADPDHRTGHPGDHHLHHGAERHHAHRDPDHYGANRARRRRSRANATATITTQAAAIGTLQGQIIAIKAKADAAFYLLLTADQQTKLNSLDTDFFGHGLGDIHIPGGGH